MRILATDAVKPDMTLGRDIYDSEGRTLLSKGITLRAPFLRRLEELGITFLYIEDGRFGAIEIDDVVADETRREAVKVIKKVMVRAEAGGEFTTRQIANSVHGIIDELIANRNSLIQLTDIRAVGDYSFAHSVSVAIMALVAGIAWGYDQRQLSTLGIGALLHDIGKSKLPQEMSNKVGPLSPTEMETMKRHAMLGFELLRRRDDVSPVAASVAFQHHERYNGTGYPRGLVGTDIHEFARLTAIADVFDVMTTDQTNRQRQMPHEAVEFLTAYSGILFDPELTPCFLSNVAIYPAGSMVRLSNQEVGVVVKNNREFPSRPLVRVMSSDETGAKSSKISILPRS
jgi:putative nucleotidyltransferase with HDIG domain